jgi:hypothetical protein
MHTVQELWELIPDDELLTETISDDSIQLCLCLFEVAVMGVGSPKSLIFLGHIQGHDVLILVDS